MWPKKIRKKNRKIEDYVSFTDFAPTILELTGLDPEKSGMYPVSGKSLTDLLLSKKSGKINPERDHVLIGKERHDVGRPDNQGYPVRGIIQGDYLYLRNFKPERWPAGNPETGYLNTDGSPTKTVLLNTLGTPDEYYWCLNFGKRPEEELYNIKEDPECMENLSESAAHKSIKEELYQKMKEELLLQSDPRIAGEGDIFDEYPVVPPERMNYYEKYMAGKAKKAGWVNPSDYRGFVNNDSICVK